MVSFAGYPLLVEGRLVGVLAMFARKFLGQDTLEALEAVADTIAQGIERKWAEEELRRSEAYLTQGERIGHTGSWGWHVGTGLVYWSKEHFRIFDYDPETTMPSYSLFLERIHPEDRFSFEEILNRAVRDKSDFESDYRIVLPDGSTKFLRSVGQALVNPSGELEFIGTVMDITDLKRGEEMRATMARERELFAQQRATELAKANEALRGCLDALASVPELDDFLGQVMAAITRQLGAVSSTLRVRNFEQNTLPLELVFQDGRVMTPDEAKYPEHWQSVSLQEQRFPFFLDQPTAIIRILDPHSPMPDDYRSYLREFGVKTVLIVPLASRGQANGRLTFRFTEERDFHPEELEIARALATQASLAIHLTRLAKAARQSAVLEERNQLAAEIHDALAQSFTGISMQLGVAGEQLAAKEGDPLRQIQLANEIAKFGLAEARRSILSLRSSAIEESGLTTTLQRLVEHSNVAGRLRCDLRSDNIPEESLPPRIQHELLRIAQEAISNAVRHAKPTVVSVTLRWEPPNLILKVKDNGAGISSASLEKSEGFGLGNMRTRVGQIGGKLDIQTAAGHGTSIVLTVPIPSFQLALEEEPSAAPGIPTPTPSPSLRNPTPTLTASPNGRNHVATRSRWRFKLFLNAEMKFDAGFFGGVSHTTSNFADTNFQTYTGGFQNYDIYINKAFLGWNGYPGLTVVAGKQELPFYATTLFWDAIKMFPQGLVERIDFDQLFGWASAGEPVSYSKEGKAPPPAPAKHHGAFELALIAGQFIFYDNNEYNFDSDLKNDSYLFEEQLLARYKTDRFSITVAPSLFIANAAGYGHDTVANGPAGNFSSVNTGGFTAPAKSDFLQFLDGTGEERDLFVVQAPGDITVKVGKIPMKFYWDFAYNFDGGKRFSLLGTAGQRMTTSTLFNGTSLSPGSLVITQRDGTNPTTFPFAGLYSEVVTNSAGDVIGYRNLAQPSDKDKMAWLLGLKIGDNKKAGDLSANVDYRQIGIAAVDSNLSFDDAMIGRLNMRGFGFGFGIDYNVTDFLVLRVSGRVDWNLTNLYGGQATRGSGIADDNTWNYVRVEALLTF